MNLSTFVTSLFLSGCLLIQNGSAQDVLSPTTFNRHGGGAPSKGYGPRPTPTPPTPPTPIIIGQCPAAPELGSKCQFCNADNSPWVTDCQLRVTITCTFIDEFGDTQPCFDPNDTTVGNQNPDPRFRLSENECLDNAPVYQATAIYEKCSINTNQFAPRDPQVVGDLNYIRLGPRNLSEDYDIPVPGWDDPLAGTNNPSGECRTHIEEFELRPCDQRFTGLSISMDGLLAQGQPNYCRCFLREYSVSQIVAPPPTPPPISPNPPTPPPTRPNPPPTPSTPRPVPTPPTECDFENVIITELASPGDTCEDPNLPSVVFARYIELKFLDPNCEGIRIDEEISVIRFSAGSFVPSTIDISLAGAVINEDGFVTICASSNAEMFYGRGECSIISGLTSPANLQGTETIAVVTGNAVNYNILDIFGIPGQPPIPSDQYFVNGRAVRKITAWGQYDEFDSSKWVVFPSCGQEVCPVAMDINEWREVVGPVCDRPTIFITEIVDVDVESSIEVPRYVELHAPRTRDRGYAFYFDLKLVIFHGSNTEPHWPSAVPIDYMPENGFLVICNRAAWEDLEYECALPSFALGGPADSNGNDQIALISGDEDGWFVIDIYGVIGEAGHDTDHDFFNSRVVRKLSVTTARSEWSALDWQVCRSDVPDPNVWDSDECGDEVTDEPTFPPTPEDQKDCQFFFTELADCEDSPFIEIYTTCPGITITRELVVVSWKNYGLSCEVNLQGLTVSADGFIIICKSKHQHLAAYHGRFEYILGRYRNLSVCDIEDSQLLLGHGESSYALVDKDANCGDDVDCVGASCSFGCNHKYLDMYGYVGVSLGNSSYEYVGRRVVRIISFPYQLGTFVPAIWEHCNDGCDPREWKPCEIDPPSPAGPPTFPPPVFPPTTPTNPPPSFPPPTYPTYPSKGSPSYPSKGSPSKYRYRYRNGGNRKLNKD